MQERIRGLPNIAYDVRMRMSQTQSVAHAAQQLHRNIFLGA
jgi:hypothetical protein